MLQWLWVTGQDKNCCLGVEARDPGKGMNWWKGRCDGGGREKSETEESRGRGQDISTTPHRPPGKIERGKGPVTEQTRAGSW